MKEDLYMNRNRFTTSILFALVLIISFVLSACTQPATNVAPDLLSHVSEDYLSDISEPTLEENRISLRESMFIYEGEPPDFGGDALDWYFFAFNWQTFIVPGHFIDFVGRETYSQWRDIPRDWRMPLFIAYLEYFNLTVEGMIIAQEIAYNRPREEIEALINWARYGIDAGFTDLVNKNIWANLVLSLSDIDALLSGDVNQLWAAFPGHGVVQNNKAYSPEWILNNITQAVGAEQIPLEEIWRIINRAENFYQLDDVVANARSALETAGEYEVIALSATEIIRDDNKDIVVTVTYRSTTARAGEVPVELLYGGSVYISENITFNGTAGQTITREYVIRNLPLTDRSRIEARINYENRPGEANHDNNVRVLARRYVPIPQNDFSVLFIQAPEQIAGNTEFNIRVAFKNDSYYNGSIPVEIIYNGQTISRTVAFTGTPFETVAEEFIVRCA